MNEPRPEVFRARFNERYRAAVVSVLDGIFLPSGASFSDTGTDVVAERTWTHQASLFLGLRDTQALTVVFRLVPAQDGMYDTKTYLYHEESGALQARDALLTPQDIMEIAGDKSAWAEQYGAGLADGFMQHLHTAGEEDYMEFLADLSSYRTSSKS